MNNRPRWFRIGVLTVVAVLLAGAAYTLFRLQATQALDRDLATGESAYEEGVKALEANKPTDAAEHFQKASLLASKVIAGAEKRRQEEARAEEQARLAEAAGTALWLRARALRDEAFAKASADGKPLTESDDTSTGGKFRSAMAIPDLKVRTEVVSCMRQAAFLLPQDKEVLNEALRTEVLLEPMQWPIVERLARAMLRVEANDPRALFVMARFEYEQPPTDPRAGAARPTPEEKRSRERIVRGVEYIEQLKKRDDYPLWRTLYLEAQMRLWLRDAATRKGQAKEEDAELKKVQALVKTAQTEAKKLLDKSGDAFKLSAWDIEGVFGMQQLGVGLAVQSARRSDGDPKAALASLESMLDFCTKAVAAKPGRVWLDLATRSSIAAVTQVEPLLVADPPPRWNEYLDGVQALGRAARDGEVINPAMYASLASLLARESYRQARKAAPGRPQELRKQALGWIDDGLRLGEKAKLPASELAPLNALAAELKMVSGGRRDAIAPHLAALRQVKSRPTTAMAARVEGALAEREGRLELARKSLEEALAVGHPDQALPVHVVLGNVYLALGEPSRALKSLTEAEKAYAEFDRLSPWEKAWILEFTRSPDDVRSLLAITHLQAGQVKADQAVRSGGQPDLQAAARSLQQHQKAAERLISKLPRTTPQGRAARLALVRYQTLTGQTDQAKQELAALRKESPNSIEVLRTEVVLIARSAQVKPGELSKEGLAEGDKRIRQFLADNPRSQEGKLFWAEWLVQTRRADQAVKYLQDPAAFPEKGDLHNRVLAVALLARGDRDKSVQLLKEMPRDPATDALLIRVLSSAEERQKTLAGALTRYENAGLFLCMEAEQALIAGKLDAAARSFCRAVEFTGVRALARRGLLTSLVQLADSKPAQVRQLALELMKDQPTEPTLYLAHAYASLLLNEVGTPKDSWDNARTMGAGLNRWEQLQSPESADRAGGPLLSARMWLMANRPDLARDEVVRAAKLDPSNPAVSVLGLQVALESNHPELLGEARRYLAVLKATQPDNPDVIVLESQLAQREGNTAAAIKLCEDAVAKKPNATLYAQLASLLREQPDGKARLRALIQKWRKELPGNVLGARMEVTQLAEDGKPAEAQSRAQRFRDDMIEEEKARLARQKAPSGVVTAEWDRQQKSQLESVRLALDFQMGRGLFLGKAVDEAGKWAERMMVESPGAVEGALLLAEVKRVKDKLKDACDLYKAVLARQRGHQVAANNLAWILAVNLKEPSQAYEVIQQLRAGAHGGRQITGDRLNPDLLDTMGAVYERLGGKDHAKDMRALFEAASQRYPRDPRMWLYLGEAYASLEEKAEADRMFQRAMKLAAPEAKSALGTARQAEVFESARQARTRLKVKTTSR